MRKNIIFSLSLTFCVVVLSFACIKTETPYKTPSVDGTSVVTVSKNSVNKNSVLETRFLNMLNHNFVYNDDFYDDSAIVNNSVLALLDTAESSFLKEIYLKDYIFNMYGKNYDNLDFSPQNLPAKSGYVYIIPRGYSEYSHKIISVKDNSDGSYVVVTEVEISTDDTTEIVKAETVFIENKDSSFGYNILYSEFIENVTADAV